MTDANQLPPLPTLQPGDSHMESLIEAAIQGHASSRDAMRWLVRQLVPLHARAQVKDEPFGYIHHYVAHDEHGALIDTTWEADGCADPLPHPTFPSMWKWSHATLFYTAPQPAQAAQPAEVTDAEIDALCLSLTGSMTRKERDRAVARAILALADFGANRNHPAQGVTDTLKDHQIAAMVNTLRDIARQFHGHQSLRERIANVLVPALKAEAQQPATTEPVEDGIRNAEDELNCAEEVLDAITCEFSDGEFPVTDFNCIGDYITAVVDVFKERLAAQQPVTGEPVQADSSEYLRVIASLGAALRRLSFAAQTTGGTAGPDAELQSAIRQAEQALSLGGIGQAMFATSEPVAVAAPHIAMGFGRYEVGSGTYQGTPCIAFGKNGTGKVGELVTMEPRQMSAEETVAVITFANAEGLDVLQEKVDEVRALHFAASSPSPWLQKPNPAPGVPDDVARDVERWRMSELIWETARKHPDSRTEAENAAFNAYRAAISTGNSYASCIDATMLAASPAQKGGE